MSGETVTPAGRPVIATFTLPLKAPIAVALSPACAVPPTAIVKLFGFTEKVKSGAAAGATTESANVAVCTSPASEPVNVTVLTPAAAVEEAVSTICCGVPGATCGPAGEAVTPAGSPVIARFTLSVNPFRAATETEVCPELPTVTLSVAGVSAIEKSGLGGGGGAGVVVTVKAVVAACVTVAAVRDVSVPVKTTLLTPAVALAGTLMLTGSGVPGVNVIVAGASVTPFGRPLAATETVPV